MKRTAQSMVGLCAVLTLGLPASAQDHTASAPAASVAGPAWVHAGGSGPAYGGSQGMLSYGQRQSLYDLTEEEARAPLWWGNYPHGDLWANYCAQKHPQHNPVRQWHPLVHLKHNVLHYAPGCLGQGGCGCRHACGCQGGCGHAKKSGSPAVPAYDDPGQDPAVPQPPAPPVDVAPVEVAPLPAQPSELTPTIPPVNPSPLNDTLQGEQPNPRRLPRNVIPPQFQSEQESQPAAEAPSERNSSAAPATQPTGWRLRDFIRIN